MYEKVTVNGSVRVPPKYFNRPLNKSIKKVLREKYEGSLDKDLGVILNITDPRDIGKGKIIHGDGSTHHNVTFDAVTFKPKLHETVRGKVSEVTDFGAFVRIGPIDALAHVSQITDDFMSYNEKTDTLTGKETKRKLKKDDEVKARIIAVSLKNNVTESKINLTMKQPGLGKSKWLEKESDKDGEN